MTGKLFIISTPIGNLDDITLRAIKVLGEVDVLACEDTRKTGLLLQNLGVAHKPQFLSYYEENELGRIPQIISLLNEGKNVGLVSNAGTPAVSDPGFKLIRECVAQNITIESIPGPSAVLTALTVSGLPTDKFLFLGFLPQKQGKRLELLKNCKLLTVNCTLIFYESPYRILRTLEDMTKVFGDIQIVICRELTKIHEEVRREKISQSITHFQKTKSQGEFTLLINAHQTP